MRTGRLLPPPPLAQAAFPSAAWAALVRQLERFALYDGVPLVLHGPAGSGKSRLAEDVHKASRRAHGPFEDVSLAGFHDELAAAELFGHERGAFTGATGRHKGRFVLANGGTLFLDEFAKASHRLQQKLLDVIETRTFRPLGAERDVHVDVRITLAYNENLEAMVERGDFLPDLYERIRNFVVEVPPLARRRADIPMLVREAVARHGAGMPGAPDCVSDALMQVLVNAPWPGNIRELDAAVARMMMMAVGADCLDLEHCAEVPGLAMLVGRRPLSEYSAEELEAEIRDSNVSAVARKLGVDRKTVYRHRRS